MKKYHLIFINNYQNSYPPLIELRNNLNFKDVDRTINKAMRKIVRSHLPCPDYKNYKIKHNSGGSKLFSYDIYTQDPEMGDNGNYSIALQLQVTFSEKRYL